MVKYTCTLVVYVGKNEGVREGTTDGSRVVIAADGGELERPNVGTKVGITEEGSIVGLAVDGDIEDGVAVDGVAVDGVAEVGTMVDGVDVEGTAVDGVTVDGAELEGLGVGTIDGCIVGFVVGGAEVGLRLRQRE